MQGFHIIFMQLIDVSISDARVPGNGTVRAVPAGNMLCRDDTGGYRPRAILTHSCSIQPLGFALSLNLIVNYIALFCVFLLS